MDSPGRVVRGNLDATAQQPDAIPRFGGESGLFRLDGVRRSRRYAPANQDLPGANTSDLTIEAGHAGHAEGKAHATAGRLQKRHAQAGRCSGTDRRFTHLTTNDGLTQDNIRAILQDHRGFMWFATGGGLNRYDGNTFVVYQHNPDDPNTLSANDTQSLIEDDRGNCGSAPGAGDSTSSIQRPNALPTTATTLTTRTALAAIGSRPSPETVAAICGWGP